MCRFGTDSPAPGQSLDPVHPATPPELEYPPQYPFSWTLRGARAQRLRAKRAPYVTCYSITGSARSGDEIAAAAAFCELHNAKLELR